jgi:hypothetical protein
MILGGGIAGLYSTYQLLKQNPDRRLILIEKNNWGGRIHTYKDEFMEVEAGGARFSNNHVLLLKLIEELHLTKKIIPISSDSQYAEGSSYNLKYILGKIIAFSKIDLLHDLTKLSFINYAKLIVSSEEVQFIEDSFGFYTELVTMNAKDAIHLFFQLNDDFYVLKGGLSQVIDKLLKHIRLCPNVELKHEEVLSIRRNKNDYSILTNKSEYITSLCICTLPHHVIEQMSFFRPLRPLLKYIVGAPLCRIYCYFDKSWFKHLPKMTTKSPLRMILPYSNKVVMFYMDNKYAMYWNDIYHKHGIYGVNKAIQYHVKDVLNIDIKPTKTKFFYWDYGVGYWGVGANSQQIAAQLQNPFPNFYICGENYSGQYQQWVEGALETSQQIVVRI